MRTFGMYIPDAACVPRLGYGRYTGDNEAGVSADGRTVKYKRFMASGRHPLKLEILRRYDPFATVAQTALTLRWRGPDSSKSKMRIENSGIFNCSIADGVYVEESSTRSYVGGPASTDGFRFEYLPTAKLWVYKVPVNIWALDPASGEPLIPLPNAEPFPGQ